MSPDRTRTFIDRGGTFTDVVTLSPDGELTVRKVPSDRAVLGALAEGDLTFGTTVATNALLERAGVPTVLFITQGFEDLPAIGDMSRPDLFDPTVVAPAPLCGTVIGVPGRLSAEGREIEPLGLPSDLDLSAFQAAAIALLHGPAQPAHELALAAWLRERAPHLHLSLGHQIDPEVGYLARIHTTLVDASITPVLRRALERDQIPDDALAMRSDGSLCRAPELRAPEAVLSGPAGGVLAVAAIAAQAGFHRAVGLDMGGTSTDVCRVDHGELPRREGALEVAGVRLRRPILEVHTIAAGGGSVLSMQDGTLHVGPQSAGADPGPQCYGRGGPPTVTDAALTAGLIDPLAFDPPLQPEKVALPAPAQDFLDLARERMASAVRQIAEARGVDLSDHALVAYGGAAGQHAAEVAARLGIRTVLIHPCASVLSAFGQCLARPEEEALEACWSPLQALWPSLFDRLRALERELPDLGETTWLLELRSEGTDHALLLSIDERDDLGSIAEAFRAVHHQRYGFVPSDPTLEVVNLRVRTFAPPRAPPPVHGDPWSIGEEPRPGPLLILSDTTAVAVPPGWLARRDRGLLRLDHVDRAEPAPPTARTSAGLSLWGHRFMAVAESAGEVLRRLARSVNIRERLDFSCAIFDPEGRLVANAPHIPVHLGAMGETVRDLLASDEPIVPGQAWLTNDPFAGGSHLPDLTVITAVEHEDTVFFVANRAHHADVGGLTPGSMPPRSKSLAEEGFVVRRLALLQGSSLRPDLAELLAESRALPTVLADLQAQIAANHQAATLLRTLGPASLIRTWMRHLQALSAQAVTDLLPSLRAGEAQDRLDDLDLRLRLTPSSGSLHVDFSGTTGPHPGNLNAPPAVVRAAVLYALRVLIGRPIPLNEGTLEPLDLSLPHPSLLSPPSGVAVAGGNVETSQRIVDLVLRATGRAAAGAGSMSNLTLGGEGWSFYETLGGGAGGRPDGPGASARQDHMTNTRATDVEVLEHRLPLRVHRFSLRRGSGGAGLHPGGEGLIREIEVLAPAHASLLACWRPLGAQGLQGGAPGGAGQAALEVDGQWQPWDGASTTLPRGARVCVQTPGGGGWGVSTQTDRSRARGEAKPSEGET
ncbi:MAG: 5-oxoprolinase [Deltaproteobacteria bacterium]|nr:MAG: 5-oxoprolinase [Deltaproteobacteria bacterium]